jgi:ketosteroid isomerase-like protein
MLLTLALQGAFSQNKDIDDLTKLNRDWLNSYPKKDTATLNRIFADDFVLISPKGVKMTRRDIISNLDKQEIFL